MPLQNQKIHSELVRVIIEHMGNLFSGVMYLKKTDSLEFVIIDTGTNETGTLQC